MKGECNWSCVHPYRGGQPGYSYEDDYIPHPRKTRKKFIRLKKWGRKRDRLGGDEGASHSEDLAPSAEDKYAVKVSVLLVSLYI